MNWLDRVIGAVSPGSGLRRVRQRQALRLMHRAYEGAKAGRRTDGWVTAGTDANAEIGPAASRLRARSRDLVRNNPYAAKAVNALVSNLVGTGIVPRARSRRLSAARQIVYIYNRMGSLSSYPISRHLNLGRGAAAPQ
jgi:capsid protein